MEKVKMGTSLVELYLYLCVIALIFYIWWVGFMRYPFSMIGLTIMFFPLSFLLGIFAYAMNIKEALDEARRNKERNNTSK